ncbi:MAG: transcriptional regulator [Syntrophobacterales bacterium CG_4_8_14_3_um_filter_49_14]|nr:MAG: transcriptional regulator [Syntrophobacterales bacterium CG23_combo_of_CG06-09_8_20_14_all_48_27]PJA48006.1 MAG: transcriptional regulator [Syntrophobacterales bacterium CG_4_9_14_3_um_filter_49_8]PJC76511.1 MAG: transcriptional regulator [Syntrophobacterales bacterium CG_4_8_14_3_um_filter_49_14]
MNTQLKEIAKVWPNIQNVFSVPHNEKDYNNLVNLLDSLIDEVGNKESHPLSSLMETIGSLIEAYESQNYPDIEGDPINALKTLMEEHGLKQSDLPEIGSQGVVSEIISGKRQLNVRQLKLLSERFKVSPVVFV